MDIFQWWIYMRGMAQLGVALANPGKNRKWYGN